MRSSSCPGASLKRPYCQVTIISAEIVRRASQSDWCSLSTCDMHTYLPPYARHHERIPIPPALVRAPSQVCPSPAILAAPSVMRAIPPGYIRNGDFRFSGPRPLFGFPLLSSTAPRGFLLSALGPFVGFYCSQKSEPFMAFRPRPRIYCLIAVSTDLIGVSALDLSSCKCCSPDRSPS